MGSWLKLFHRLTIECSGGICSRKKTTINNLEMSMLSFGSRTGFQDARRTTHHHHLLPRIMATRLRRLSACRLISGDLEGGVACSDPRVSTNLFAISASLVTDAK